MKGPETNKEHGSLNSREIARPLAGYRTREELLRVLNHWLSNEVFGASPAAGLKSQEWEEPQAQRQMDSIAVQHSHIASRLT